MTTPAPIDAIVLAAQRKGIENPLAARFGVSHKCLIPLRGKPLIAHILQTMLHHKDIAGITVCVEPELFDAVQEIAEEIAPDAQIRLVPAADNLADSVIGAAGDGNGPWLITTADNALLSADTIARVRRHIERADGVIVLAREDDVKSTHAEGQRRFYSFRDGGVANCNTYAIANREALSAAEVFRSGGQFMKNADRIVSAFGLTNLVLLKLGLASVEGAMARISDRLGMTIEPLVVEDGSQAIDVDNDRTYGVVEELLERRSA